MNHPKISLSSSGHTNAYMKGARHCEKGGRRSDNPYTQRNYIDNWFNGYDDEKESLLPSEFKENDM